MAEGADGALWVGTGGGVARLDKDGGWQTYSKANTRGGLPVDRSWRGAGADGALWVGTGGGLARLDKDGGWQTYSRPAPRAACRTMTSERWRAARTARCGSEPAPA